MYPQRNWIESPLPPIPEDFAYQIGGHPIILRTLINRGFKSVSEARAFIDPKEYPSTPPQELPDLERAVSRIEEAIRKGEVICIWGDFDVDGQTATALLSLALQRVGGDVIHHIPIRAVESHGIDLSILRQIIRTKQTPPIKVLLTCDTGVTSYEALAYAREHGIDAIVTDHHALPERLPEAFAIVNPKFLPESHKLATLSGVGVAYKLVEEILRRATQPELSQTYLDLVALGLIADVTPLIGEARYLVQEGLIEIRKSTRTGLRVMFEALELDPANLSEEHLAYLIAPRLNAIGRLTNAELGFEFLTTEDSGLARQYYLQIEAINSKRKLIENQVFQGALKQISDTPRLMDEPILVLSNPKWPAGVIGIVASRLVERYHKPVVLISSPANELARGSARSIEGINIYEVLSQQKHLLVNFGGHPMAAGFSITSERISDLKIALEKTIGEKGQTPGLNLVIDGFIQLSELSTEFADDLERLAPFGAGNPSPILVSQNMCLSSYTTVGRDQEHLLVNIEDERGNSFRVISWLGAERVDIHKIQDGLFDLAYTIRSSTYKGKRGLQIEMIDFQSMSEKFPFIVKGSVFEIKDYRQEHDPINQLASLISHASVQVWAEANHQKELSDKLQSTDFLRKLRNRYELSSCEELIIWTIPPRIREISQVIGRVNPKRVYLFALDPELDQLENFLNRMIGLLRFIIMKKSGRAGISELSTAMAHQEETIMKGIEFFSLRGVFRINLLKEGEILVEPGGRIASEESSALLEQLRLLLAEAAAFRAYYRRVDKDDLLRSSTYS